MEEKKEQGLHLIKNSSWKLLLNGGEGRGGQRQRPRRVSSDLKILKEPKGTNETMEHLFWGFSCFRSMAHMPERGLFRAESGLGSGRDLVLSEISRRQDPQMARSQKLDLLTVIKLLSGS